MFHSLPSRPGTVALSSKLVLGFAMICAILAAIGGLVFFGLRSLELLDKKTRASAFDEIGSLRNVARDADAMHNHVLLALSVTSPEDKRQLAAFIARLQSKSRAAFSSYENRKLSGDKELLVQEIARAGDEYFGQVEKLLAAAAPSAQATGVSTAMIAQEVAAYQTYEKTLRLLFRFEEGENREMAGASSNKIAQTKNAGDILIGLAILTGVWTGLILYRLIDNLRDDKRRLEKEVEERERAAAALAESEARYRLLLDHSPDAILLICDNKIVFANPSAVSLLRAERPERLIGRSPAEIVHPDEREEVARRNREAIAGRPPPSTERRMVRLDGTSVEVESRVIPFFYEGKPATQVIVRDNTERKIAAEKLSRHEKQYRLLFDDNPSPMWVYDTRTLKFLAINQAAISHYGYSREEFLSRTLTSIRPAKELPRFLAVVGDPGSPKEYSGIWQHQTKEGRIITVAIHSSPIDFDGHKARLATAFDITERMESERRIREREASLALAQHVAGVGSWEYQFGADGRIDNARLFWSAEVYHLFGYSVGDFRPSTAAFFQAVHPEDRAKVAEHFREFQNRGGRLSFDHRIIRSDGSESVVHVAAEVITAGSEGRSKVIGTIMDITEQVTKAKNLAEAEKKYRTIFANASEGIFQSSPEGKFLVVNPAATRIFGFDSAEEMIAHRNDITHQSYVDPNRRAEFMHQIDEAGVVNDFECEVYRKDGSKVWISENARIVRDEAGRTLYFEGTIQDISERKHAAERLREQANLLNLAHDAIMVRDVDDRIVFWNNGAERLYGWTEEEVRGRAISEFLHYVDPEAMQAAQEIFLQTGKWSGEKKDRTKNGETLVVHSRWSLVRDEQGRPKSKLVIDTDITEQKKIEEQFLRAQRLESIGTLASGVAHDLNNILLPIMMAAPILREEMDPEERDKFLDIVEANARRGADIIKQVLTFARGADGDHVLLQPIYLLEEVAKIASQTFPKSITIRTTYDESVHSLEADPTQLHQVLLNLCINARDAMPNGGQLHLTVENFDVEEHFARLTPGATTGPYVMFQVTDSGTGIPEDVVEKIFDPFFTTKGIGLGTGLGLSTVAGIVKSHGGFLKLYSEPRHTSFSVFLPARIAADEGKVVEAVTLAPKGHGEIILVVDDEPNIREVAQLILRDHGYTVEVAEDGPTALAIFAQQIGKVAAVVTDLAMPVMGGLMLVRTLRRLQPGLKIIVSTGRADETQADEIAALGVDGCLTKPYTTRNLLFKLHNVLRSVQDADAA